MEVHLVPRIRTVTNHQVMEQNSGQVSLKELESMAARDLARRLLVSVLEQVSLEELL